MLYKLVYYIIYNLKLIKLMIPSTLLGIWKWEMVFLIHTVVSFLMLVC